jgi:large subunit ribosomal protein L25
MATQSTLNAQPRQANGKGPARRVRTSGLIPAVVYGRHLKAPLHISVDPLAIKAAINTSKRLNTVIAMTGEGGARNVMLKDYQQDPVTRAVLHADFLDVLDTEQVKVKVPVALVGKAEGQTVGGILSQMRREIEVWALPGRIPEKIDADVTHLKITQALHINDIKMPEGVTVKTHVNYTIAVVLAPEAEVVAAVAAVVPGAEGAAPAAGAAPGAAGAAPAAGAAAGKPGDAKAGDAKGAAAAAPAKKK